MPVTAAEHHAKVGKTRIRASKGSAISTALLFATGLMWGVLGYHLSGYWGTIEQYSYGWLVLPLSVFAGFLRWQTRPEPTPPLRAAYVPIVAGALLFLPTWLLLQPSPEWRSVSWMLAIETIAVTLGFVALAGGSAWLRHFAWPACLILTAVPWQRPIEIPLTEELMRGVAAVTVELLNLTGINSVRQGSLIELSAGLLGVDEACSGIRSLQAAIMAAFVLGELFRLKLARRFLLVIGGVLIALAINVGRTYLLAFSAHREGIAGVDRWHDLAGVVMLSLCFAGVWALAKLLEGDSEPFLVSDNEPSGNALPGKLVWGITIWIPVVLIATELWFRGDEPPEHSRWVIAPPAGHQELPMKKLFYDQLRYDGALGAAWRESDGGEWYMYFFEWKPGPLRSRIMARLHRPENCLSAAGLKLVGERAPITVQFGPEVLTFRSYTFEQQERPFYVYHGVFESRGSRAMAAGRLTSAAQFPGITALIRRERNLGQQVAELATPSFGSAEEADESFRELLRQRLTARSPVPGASGTR